MRTWSLRFIRHIFHPALSALRALGVTASAIFKSRAALRLENLALRHQLGILRRSVKRPKLTAADRFLWAWLSRVWADRHAALVIVKPETVIAWHRKGFRRRRVPSMGSVCRQGWFSPCEPDDRCSSDATEGRLRLEIHLAPAHSFGLPAVLRLATVCAQAVLSFGWDLRQAQGGSAGVHRYLAVHLATDPVLTTHRLVLPPPVNF